MDGTVMAITTMDGLVAALPAFGTPFLKTSFAPQVAGSFTSLWAQAGIPGAGANSSSGVAGDVPTDATAGAFPFTNVASSYLARFSGYATIAGQLLLYDRLWQNSGLSVTTTGGQTVQANTPLVPLTRPDANGAAAEAWLQVYTTLGAGSTAKTITYTDQDGNLSQTGTLQGFVTTAAAQRTFPFALAAGDTGVRSIQSFDNVATSTSGTLGLIIRRFIAMLSMNTSTTGASLDPITGGLPRVYDDASLELIWIATATTSMNVGGTLALAQG